MSTGRDDPFDRLFRFSCGTTTSCLGFRVPRRFGVPVGVWGISTGAGIDWSFRARFGDEYLVAISCRPSFSMSLWLPISQTEGCCGPKSKHDRFRPRPTGVVMAGSGMGNGVGSGTDVATTDLTRRFRGGGAGDGLGSTRRRLVMSGSDTALIVLLVG